MHNQMKWQGSIVLLTWCGLLCSQVAPLAAADPQSELRSRAIDNSAQPSGELRLIQYVESDSHDRDVAERLSVDELEEGTSSSRLKDQAIRALPMRQMHPTHRQRISEIVENTSLFRRLPTVSMQVEPEVYQFFATHPEVAVSMWRVLGISEFRMQHTGAGKFKADAGDGTLGHIDVLYQTANECVAVCDGQFQPSLPVKPIRALAVIHLETSLTKDRQGFPVVTHRMDMFVSFPSQPIQVAVKLVSPLGHRIIDKNFTEVSRFVKMMSVAMESRPDWVEAIGRRMDDVEADRRQKFLELVSSTHATVRKRHLSLYMQNPGTGSTVTPANSIGNPRQPAVIAVPPGQGISEIRGTN